MQTHDNPFNTGYEQQGLEHIGRAPLDDDETNLVVMLGTN